MTINTQQWKHTYGLYTEAQQLYFWSFVVANVAMIKYIHIEFASQPCMIDLYADVPSDGNLISDLLSASKLKGEQRSAQRFKGVLLPPSDVWQASSDINNTIMDIDTEKKPCKTKTLKKAQIVNDQNKIELGLYSQEAELSIVIILHLFSDNHSITSNLIIHSDQAFTRQQAHFLRLTECIRLSFLKIFLCSSTLKELYTENSRLNMNILVIHRAVYGHGIPMVSRKVEIFKIMRYQVYLKMHL